MTTALAEHRTVGVSIERPPADVYRFAGNPANLPRWLDSFVRSAENRGGQWILHTDSGPMEIDFIRENEFGVLDHRITLPSGDVLVNPMRVVANGRGSTVLFTLFRTATMGDSDFERDLGMVRRDLETLKRLLEEGGS